MRVIERRIQSIEKRIGGEVKEFVFIHNKLKVNPNCGAYNDIGLCPPYQRVKQDPDKIRNLKVNNGVAIVWPPCEKCDEVIEK